MANTNLRYQNGLKKRSAVRAVRARMRSDGSLVPQRPADVEKRLGYKPHYMLDTNLAFVVIEYWGDETRKGLIELAKAQDALRLFLLDIVDTECRGTLEKQALYDSIVWNGHNPDVGVIRPLDSQTRKVGEIFSRIVASIPEQRGLPSASDRKDMLIAAAAIAYDMTVLTRNRKDFAAIAAREPALRFAALSGGEQADLMMGALILDRLADDFRTGAR